MKLINLKLTVYCSLLFISLLLSNKTYSQPIEFFSSQRNIDNNYPFSNAVRVDNFLFLSGELGTLPNSSKLIEGGIKNETKQTMENIKTSLSQHGLTMNDVVKCTVMLADIKDWPTFNQVYKSYFPKHFPARSAFATNGLGLNARVELECMAAFSENNE